ncbi:FAD:protein FMN transferase [Gimesia aquarii]|uniref:FAD:protein FMN transferase n=1 Tax=Gimesia aquarii TaxID=2527964 RepID=A0A517WPM1_9PLAN|nr:FAD:protein FMN transferase [Gimesia aquarii]QDU07203.1 Thiamine biosynthesis lipoprotein ApbE precursor [Gimesia aquarii]
MMTLASRCHKPFLRVAVLLLLIFPVTACQTDQSGSHTGSAGKLQIQGSTMGTSYHITICTSPSNLVDSDLLKQEVDQLLENINAQMSTYIETSELSRFNQSQSDQWFEVSPSVLKVVEAGLNLSKASTGAFDMTVGPLVNLWHFGPDPGKRTLPESSQIEAARKNVGYQHIELQHVSPALKKLIPKVYLDLSAIAKGYAVDRVTSYLDSKSIENYLVEIGGEMRAKGTNQSQVPWKVGIEKPISETRKIQKVVPLSNLSMATSGNYRNFFEVNGKTYSHTIDPRTGYPVDHSLASVTVVGETCMNCDALATCLMVLGPDEGYNWAKEREIAAYFIVKEENGFTERYSPRWQKLLGEENES